MKGLAHTALTLDFDRTAADEAPHSSRFSTSGHGEHRRVSRGELIRQTDGPEFEKSTINFASSALRHSHHSGRIFQLVPRGKTLSVVVHIVVLGSAVLMPSAKC